MAIEVDSTITWSDLIAQTKTTLKSQIENLTGATIPSELRSVDVELSRTQIHTQQSGILDGISYAKSNRNWTTVSWSTVESDFNSFLSYCNLNTNDRANQLVSTRLLLNFFENLSLFYTNRLILVYSPVGNKPKRLYYYNDGSSYASWVGAVRNIETPVIDVPVTADEINIMLASINSNLKNKIKTYSQSYSYYTTSCSCSSSCSSSSSSSSCCSCLTIVHQDLSLL